MPTARADELYGTDEPHWADDVYPIAGIQGYFVLFQAFRGPHAGRLHVHDFTGDWMPFGFMSGEDDPPTLPHLLETMSLFGATPWESVERSWFTHPPHWMQQHS